MKATKCFFSLLLLIYVSLTNAQVTVSPLTTTIENSLNVGSSGTPLFAVDDVNRHMYFNYSAPIGSSDFVLSSKHPLGFGGMYINSQDANSGKPFYGYSIDGVGKAFHFYDETDDTWNLFTFDDIYFKVNSSEVQALTGLKVGLEMNSIPAFKIEEGPTRRMYFNTNQSIGSSDFVLNSSNSTGFGGIYINSDDTNAGKPFYGYATGGTGYTFHYLDSEDDYWKLFHIDNHMLAVGDQQLIVSGSVNVGPLSTVGGTGSIYYDGNHFYGVTTGGPVQLDNTTNVNLNNPVRCTDQDHTEPLEYSNVELMDKVRYLEKRLAALEKHLQK